MVDGTPFGRYRLVELLGRGGMGEIWRAYDPDMNRVVALKVLPPDFAGDQVFQERFRREARAAAGLDEPHLVPIYEFGEIEGRLYVTMRLIRGHDLQVLLEGGPLEPARAVGIIEQIASALHAAHQIGLVHRDVKPSNILVAEDDFAYLIDFGIARAAGDTALTNTGATVGTWAYMAPERLSAGNTDARVDVYALACVLHEALTGRRPYPGDSAEQQIVGHLTVPPPRPSMLESAVPEPLDAVIATGMAKDPYQRYQSAKDLARAARATLTAPIPSPPAPPPPPTQPPQLPTQPETIAQLPSQHAMQGDIPPAHMWPTPDAAAGPFAGQNPPPWPNQPLMQWPAGPEVRGTAWVPPAYATSRAGGAPTVDRQNRGTKVALVVAGLVVLAVVAAVAVALLVIDLGQKSSKTSTTGSAMPTTFPRSTTSTNPGTVEGTHWLIKNSDGTVRHWWLKPGGQWVIDGSDRWTLTGSTLNVSLTNGYATCSAQVVGSQLQNGSCRNVTGFSWTFTGVAE